MHSSKKTLQHLNLFRRKKSKGIDQCRISGVTDCDHSGLASRCTLMEYPLREVNTDGNPTVMSSNLEVIGNQVENADQCSGQSIVCSRQRYQRRCSVTKYSYI